MKLSHAQRLSLSDNPKSKIQNPKLYSSVYKASRYFSLIRSNFFSRLPCFLLNPNLSASSTSAIHLAVRRAISGWRTALDHLKNTASVFEPIFIRGGVQGVQALLARDVLIEMQGASAIVNAWAQGAKELRYVGAVGNKLDYILVGNSTIKTPADLKGKRSRGKPDRLELGFRCALCAAPGRFESGKRRDDRRRRRRPERDGPH